MVSVETLRRWIERLAAIDRSSCSAGEHQAAEAIAAELRACGADVQIERERVHGTYWWPLGVTSTLGVLGLLAARRGRWLTGTALGSLAAGAVVDDLGAGRRWLRSLLPKRLTSNVVAEMGDREAPETVLVVAHHDAAHTGAFFNPRITSFVAGHLRSTPGVPPRLPPLMASIAAAPALVAVGALVRARRLVLLGGSISATIGASLIEAALRPTVPGANDNLTGVATILALASRLHERPAPGLRVILVSTGSEESLMEGMWAFARRHFAQLDRARTRVLCVDTVGSPHLVLAEAEGMIHMRPYDPDFNGLIAACAGVEEVPLMRGFKMRLGTDGYLALRHGFRAAMLTSVDDHGAPSNYHWPTDTPDRVDYGTLEATVRLCEAVVRRLSEDARRPPPASVASTCVDPPAR